MSRGYVADSKTKSWCSGLMADSRYLALHFEIPSLSDPGASEFTSPGYARVRVDWTSESDRAFVTSETYRFGPVAEALVAAVSGWTEPDGGDLLFYGVPDPERPILVDDQGIVTLPRGEFGFAFGL